MSETSSTTLPPSQVTDSVTVNSQASAVASSNNVTDFEIEYENINTDHHNNADDDEEEYCRIAERIDELLNKTNTLRSEVQVPKSVSQLNEHDTLSIDDEEYDYEYEYDGEEEMENDSKDKSDSLPDKDLPASEAITQAPYQERLPDFGQLRHASNKWNIAAISGEDAETNFDDDDDDECNEIEIALEEPASKIVGQLEQLLEEDEQDEVDELMPDALIQQTTTSNPLLLGAIDLPLTPSPAASPQPGDSVNSGDLLFQIRYAALNNDLTDFRTLLDNNPGFFIDAILKAGWTALMYGSYRANVDIVRECLSRGADPNYHKESFTPLMAVCCSRMETCDYVTQSFMGQTRMLDTLKLLINAGGSVLSQDRFGCTALQYAARFGRRLLVNTLLEAGSIIDAPNCNGWTALHWAAAEGHGDVVETLLSHGANPNLKATDPELELSPGELAAMKGHEDISDQILNATFSNESPSPTESKVPQNDNETILQFHDDKLDLRIESEIAENLLQLAIDSANFELSLKQMHDNVNNLPGPELRKRTTLVIDEWDEDTKRILANQTQQPRRKSSTVEGFTDPKSLIFSLIIAALLFLVFRFIFGAIFS